MRPVRQATFSSVIRWTGSSRSPARLQSTQRVAAVKPSLSCPAVPHQDHLPPGRLFGGVSPAPGRSRTSRVCRSGSAPGNALSASGRLSLYVVSRRSPVRSSVMYQLKNSVGFGIACGARTTLPRIQARACRREGYRTSGRSHQSGCHAGTEGESAARASLAPLCRHWIQVAREPSGVAQRLPRGRSAGSTEPSG